MILPSYEKSFASHEKSQYWSDKNDTRPNEVYLQSNKEYLFDCNECHHEFKVRLYSISGNNRSWCPFCVNKKLCGELDCVLCFEKSFVSHEKSIYWSENNKFTPLQVFKYSDKKYLFDCNKCNHQFSMQLDVISQGCWCNYCANRVLCEDIDCKICFEKSFASSIKSQHWSRNNILSPRQVFKSSQKKYLFDCDECDHEFSMSTIDITNIGCWCNYCANKILCEDIECQICFEKSFASSNKVNQWGHNNGKNPRTIFKYSNVSFEFDCFTCGHQFKSSLNDIAKKDCPYCANKKLCPADENCLICIEKSFFKNKVSKYWSNKNLLQPREIFLQSNRKCWFDCPECNHEFKGIISNINNNQSWCPYCANRKLCSDDNCNLCFNNSFASHPKSIYFSDTNKLNSREIFKNSNSKFDFKCENNHNFSMTLASVNKNGSWCPNCYLKTERKLYEWFLGKNINCKSQETFTWSNFEGSKKRYDFLLENLNIIVEVDGPQHFRQISNWNTPESCQINDDLKNKLALDNGFHMIRIYQESVLFDRENWEILLLDTIELMKKNETPIIHKIGSIYEIKE